jgi:phosphoglycerol transferase MdoB-like AlkP superfamily enzyme
MAARVRYLIKVYLWTVVVFIIAKVGFMLCCREGHEFSFSDVWQVITHGVSLDMSTALYVLIIPFLLIIVSVWWNNEKVLKWILRIYFIIIAIAFALAFVADTSLYPFWGFKLDASCLQFLDTPGDMASSVTTGYLLWRLLILVLTAFLIYKGYPKSLTPTVRKPLMIKISETAFYIICMPLIVIGIRGGLDESTTNIGQVYYSQNQFLNHSAVNPVFSFLSSFEKTASNIVDYDYYTDAECAKLMKGLYPTTSVDTDTLLTTKRPNIVIVLMESAGDIFAGVMPNLQRLKAEGINFSNCFGNTWRTDRGTVCTYSGYPSFPTSSVMKMPKKAGLLPSVASSLQREGYHTYYLYGGDINFTNMRSYLIATGWEKLTWKADYNSEEQNSANWGVRDDITFNTLYQQITSMPQDEHYLIGFSTLSSHEPWDVPVKKYEDEVTNAFYYLDQCIGDFITKLKQTPQWENLLIIFLPDHSIDYGSYTESEPLRNKIPQVWTGGAVKCHQDIAITCNQTDFAATLLAQLRVSHDQFRWSRDVLSKSYEYPFATHNYNNGFSLTDSTGFMAYDLESRQVITNKSSETPRLEKMGKAILQATTKDLKTLNSEK